MYHKLFKSLKPIALSLFLFSASSYVAVAQNRVIDSLKSVMDSKAGREKFVPAYDIVFEFIYQKDFPEALKAIDVAERIASEAGDSLRIVKCGRVKGQILGEMARTDEAIKQYLSVLPIAKRNSKTDKTFLSEYKLLLNSLAVSSTYQANYDKALDYNFQALVIKEAEGNDKEISITLNNIGLVYFKLKNHEKALEYYMKALELKNRSNDNNFKDRLQINIGLTFNQLKAYQKAQEYIDAGLKFCEPNCAEVTVMEGQFGLGLAAYGLKDYAVAEKHFQESLTIATKVDDNRFKIENLVNLARIKVVTTREKEALQALAQAERIAEGTAFNQLLIDIFEVYALAYNHLNDYENASRYQAKYINLKDSVYSENLIKNLSSIITKYEERENIKTIQDKDEVIARQRSLTIAIVIIAVLAALLIFVLYKSNQVKKKVNQALSEAKLIIEDQNRQLLSSNYNLNRELKEKNSELERANQSLLKVNEELDNFIYKTSHDIRGPLASLKGMCNVALMDVKDAVALSYLKKLDITADKLNTILTRLLIVNQINNSSLASESIDFVEIINDLLLLERKKGLPPRLAISRSVDPNIQFFSDKEFVRIILENLIDNAIKFYNDSQRVDPFVDITVAVEKNNVVIRVLDNGIGISEVHPDKIFQMFSRASERSETGGIGLYITKTAAEKLGGIVDLRTTKEGYTEFSVSLPIVRQPVIA